MKMVVNFKLRYNFTKSKAYLAWFSTDYYPFGMPMPNRIYSLSSGSKYRFGFNGKEKDDEVYGEGNALDFGARIYDSRIGRFLSVDLAKSGFSFESQYSFAGSTPIQAIDIEGNAIYFVNIDGNSLLNNEAKEALNTLANTALGLELLNLYANSTTHDIYIYIYIYITVNSINTAMAGTSGLDIDNNGKMTRNNTKESLENFSNFDFSRSKGRKVFLIQIDPKFLPSNSEHTKYSLAETIYHEIWCHVKKQLLSSILEHIEYGDMYGSPDIKADLNKKENKFYDSNGNLMLDPRKFDGSNIIIKNTKDLQVYKIRKQLVNLMESNKLISNKFNFLKLKEIKVKSLFETIKDFFKSNKKANNQKNDKILLNPRF